MGKITGLKTYYTEEIKISPEYLVECYIEDYGEDGEKILTKSEELTRNKYYQGRYKRKTGMRLFCRDCPYYKKCKGVRWVIGCEPKKEFFRIIEKYKKKGKKSEQNPIYKDSDKWGIRKIRRKK